MNKTATFIRRARSGDAEALARIAEDTFRATFAGLNAAEDMELHCKKSFGAAIQAREIADPDMLTLLCEEDGRLVAFAQLRWGAAPDGVETELPGEIHRLYVDHPWHGRGIAQALMAACTEEARQRGTEVIWLGVWERNPRAIAFYRKCGFVEAGEHVFLLGADPQRDIIMVRSIETGCDDAKVNELTSMVPDALVLSADSSAECLELASEMLASGDGVVLLDGELVLRQTGRGLVAEVIDSTPSAHRCQNEYEVMVENARYALAASPFAALLPDLPRHWRVIEESEDGCRIAWRTSR